jgi:hypothetical protein
MDAGVGRDRGNQGKVLAVGDAMPRNDGPDAKEARRYPKRRPFIVQAALIGVGIALIPIAGLGILFLKKVTAKPSDSEEDADLIIKKYSN